MRQAQSSHAGSRRAAWAFAAICPLVLTGMGAARPAAPPAEFPEEWFFGDEYKVRRLEGQPAPELNVAAWIGEPVTLEKLRGRVVVLDMWAAWCHPCIAAMPTDARIARKYADRGVVLVAVHDGKRAWEQAVAEVSKRQVQYSVARDTADPKDCTAARYLVEGWPTYVVIDRGGTVRAAGVSPEHVEDVLERLLLEPEAPAPARDAWPAEFYLGGRTRLAEWRAMEGREVPTLMGDQWIGAPAPSLRTGGITVLHFWRPGDTLSTREFDALRAAEADLAGRGAKLVCVCDRRADWADVRARAAAGGWTTPIMHDAAAPAGGPAAARGGTAAALGVDFVPTTMIIDGEGRIRAAGVRTAKVAEIVDAVRNQPTAAPAAGTR